MEYSGAMKALFDLMVKNCSEVTVNLRMQF